jgi:hypothetical protein
MRGERFLSFRGRRPKALTDIPGVPSYLKPDGPLQLTLARRRAKAIKVKPFPAPDPAE